MHQVTYFNEQENNEGLNANLDMLEVNQDDAYTWNIKHIRKYYQ